MKVIFMGTPGFAVESLKQIHESSHEVVAVVTAPDRPAGRGRKLKASEVKQYANENGIEVLQPEKLRAEDFLNQLDELAAELYVVVAFRMLPELVWSKPPKGTINLHACLLPQYRGAAPINWAIINGESKTGATTFFINAEIDKGATIEHVEVEIKPEDCAGDLHDRLMVRGAQLLLNTVNKISKGTAESQAQSTQNLTLKAAPKLNPSNRKINWKQSAQNIHNLVRGLSPFPSAYATLNNGGTPLNCKIYRSEVLETERLNPGQIESDGKTYLHVGTANKDLAILDLHVEGKKKLGIRDLLNGFNLESEADFQ